MPVVGSKPAALSRGLGMEPPHSLARAAGSDREVSCHFILLVAIPLRVCRDLLASQIPPNVAGTPAKTDVD
jgi:hypothetical protein